MLNKDEWICERCYPVDILQPPFPFPFVWMDCKIHGEVPHFEAEKGVIYVPPGLVEAIEEADLCLESRIDQMLDEERKKRRRIRPD